MDATEQRVSPPEGWHGQVQYRLTKYDADIADWRGGRGFLRALRQGELVQFLRQGGDALFRATHQPYETLEGEGNLLVNAGISLMEDLLIGAGGTTFANANARLGVGDSSTAAAASQTDLQAAANKLRKVMDATFPSRSGQTLTFQATFTGAEATWTWNEWALFNAAAAGTMLNRKIPSPSFGAKAAGVTWTLQVTIVIS